MPTELITPTSSTPRHTSLRAWWAVSVVTLALFAIVTTEILPIGLLTPIGAEFGVADGTAGLMMTIPASSPPSPPRR